MRPPLPRLLHVRWEALHTPRVRYWPEEDEVVVFSAASGDLHLLNVTAIAVLAHLAETPSTLDELAARFPAPDGALAALITSFDVLGLVRPIGP